MVTTPLSSAPAATPAPRVAALLPLLAGPAVAALAVAACLATYREWVDGPRDTFLLALGAGVAGALLLSAALFLWAPPRARSPLLVALVAVAALSPTIVAHGARLLNRRASLVVSAPNAAAYRRLAEPSLQGGATLDVLGETLTLRVPPRGAAFLEVRVPGDDLVPWSFPRALLRATSPAQNHVLERLDWRAALDRQGTYLTLVDSDRAQVNVTEWGLLVARPDASGQVGSDSVSLPEQNGAWHDWALVRANGRRTLLMDGREVWSGVDPGPFHVLRVGETRPDPEHSGAVHLQWLRYQRRAVA